MDIYDRICPECLGDVFDTFGLRGHGCICAEVDEDEEGA
jgi:hypothetical protein